jgi:putative phage-type endonuclease
MSGDIEQRSDDWFAIRCGKATASRIADIVAKTKSGPSASRANYMAQLVSERLTGVAEQGYSNAAMQWGCAYEADARAAYSFREDADVIEVGFVEHPTIAWSGASPDGLVGDDGLVEIKCPNTATHIDTLLSGKVPEKYRTQMLWQMACTGRKWCDFVSYDPRLPEKMRLFVARVERSEAEIAELEDAVAVFLKEVADKVIALREAYDPQPANDDAEHLVNLVRAG